MNVPNEVLFSSVAISFTYYHSLGKGYFAGALCQAETNTVLLDLIEFDFDVQIYRSDLVLSQEAAVVRLLLVYSMFQQAKKK